MPCVMVDAACHGGSNEPSRLMRNPVLQEYSPTNAVNMHAFRTYQLICLMAHTCINCATGFIETPGTRFPASQLAAGQTLMMDSDDTLGIEICPFGHGLFAKPLRDGGSVLTASDDSTAKIWLSRGSIWTALVSHENAILWLATC